MKGSYISARPRKVRAILRLDPLELLYHLGVILHLSNFGINSTHLPTEQPFPVLENKKLMLPKADVSIFRRKEVSRMGRFLRSNGVDNNGKDALTLLIK